MLSASHSSRSYHVCTSRLLLVCLHFHVPSVLFTSCFLPRLNIGCKSSSVIIIRIHFLLPPYCPVYLNPLFFMPQSITFSVSCLLFIKPLVSVDVILVIYPCLVSCFLYFGFSLWCCLLIDLPCLPHLFNCTSILPASLCVTDLSINLDKKCGVFLQLQVCAIHTTLC